MKYCVSEKFRTIYLALVSYNFNKLWLSKATLDLQL